MPEIDLAGIAVLAAFAGIAGSGGLTNVPVSNYTRDQGWGMGKHVGAIPSIVGGQNIALSHVGMVSPITPESLPRFRRWYRHVMRDQLVVWMPACFLGMALPSMLAVQFLRRGTEVSGWATAVMTADGVSKHVGRAWGELGALSMWYLTLFCGFLCWRLGRPRPPMAWCAAGSTCFGPPASGCGSGIPRTSSISTSACCAAT